MHAFDYRYVGSGKIIVRPQRAGRGPDDARRQCPHPDARHVVIADETKAHRPCPGIMGGENSEIMDDTVDVVFESANFNGTSIRQTALALGMRTEASGKFEKNIDRC